MAIAGELGNTALALYDTVKNPDSAIINVLGMLIGVGSITKVSRDADGIGSVAAARRGMKADDIAALGKIFSDNDSTLKRVLGKLCSA